jgi:putative drug exporter of the RND superfamily
MLTGRYVTADHTAGRFEVLLGVNPYGNAATDVVRTLRETLPEGEAAVSGYPAIITDLRDIMDRDTVRSFSLVLLGIFFVLLFLLRAVVAPLYLLATILLSYGATMGITRLASGVLFGTETLTWWVPFFMFVMLVALGMDYNIFLMGRVKEEVANYGMREGVHRAVAATGAIITSAGLIMARTFGAMMAGMITGLKQLGFAVAVGVLLDTFVIRTALVPAIAVLLDRWNWWPGHMPQAKPQAAPAPGDD